MYNVIFFFFSFLLTLNSHKYIARYFTIEPFLNNYEFYNKTLKKNL